MTEFYDIVKREPELIQYMSYDKWIEFYSGEAYHLIFKALSEGFKVFEEIYDYYSMGEKKKSISTIQRYKRDLINEGLVFKAGRRVITGQSASKILFSRSSVLYIPLDPIKSVWGSESGLETADILGHLIKQHFGEKYPDVVGLLDFIKKKETKFAKIEQTLFKKIAEEDWNLKNQKKMRNEAREVSQKELALDHINDLIGDAGVVFFNLIGWVAWYLSETDYEEFIPTLKSFFKLDSPVNIEKKLLTKKKINECVEETYSSDTEDIIRYKQKNIMYVPSNLLKKLYEIDILAVQKVLQGNKPLTIKEIHQKHPEKVQKFIESSKKDRKKGSVPIGIPEEYLIPLESGKVAIPKPKAENTVYRYVQELIKHGIVVEAGRRITEDQTFTQILYTTAARLIIFLENKDEFWEYEEWKQVTYAMAVALKYLLNKKSFNYEKFHELITELEKSRWEATDRLLSNVQDLSLLNRLVAFYNEHNASIRILGIIEWFWTQKDAKSTREKLLACFN